MPVLPRRKSSSFEGDPLIPIMNLVCMLIPLLLYGAVFVRFTTLTVNAPKIPIDRGEKIEEPKENLDLTIFATDQGFHVKVNPRFREPWMAQAQTGNTGPDIPRKDGDWDYGELSNKLRELKSNHDSETRIILGAEDDVPFDVLIKMMDTSRGAPEKTLFPQVTLTRGFV